MGVRKPASPPGKDSAICQRVSATGQLSAPHGIMRLALGPSCLALEDQSIYSVHGLRGKVAELRVDMERGPNLLERLKEVVECGCCQLAGYVNAMSDKLATDAAYVEDNVLRAVKEELEIGELRKKMVELVEQYRVCFSVLACGNTIEDADCERLERAAATFLARIESAIKTTPKGHSGCLPLVALHTFATRAYVDAHDMRSLGKAPSEEHSLEERLMHARTLVENEVEAMLNCRSLTVYTAGVVLAPALAQYHLLHQGLSLALQHSASQKLPDGSAMVSAMSSGDNAVWDDGLDMLRVIFANERRGGRADACEELVIATVSDFQWFTEWKQLQAGNLVSQIPKRVMLKQILMELGVPMSDRWGLNPESVDKLKSLVLPDFRRRAEGLLTKAWEVLKMDVHLVKGDGTSLQTPGDRIKRRWVGRKCVMTLKTGRMSVQALALASDGSVFCSVGDETHHEAEKGWSVRGRTDRPTIKQEEGRETVCGNADRHTIKQWRDGKCVATLRGHTRSVTALVFRSDGMLFSGSDDRSIRQWDSSKECKAVLKGHTNWVRALALASDGTLFSGSHDMTIKQWRGELCIATLAGHRGDVLALAFAPDGTLFSGGRDRAIRQWKGTHCVAIHEGHKGPVTSLAFRSSDSMLFSGSDDKTIRQWNWDEESKQWKYAATLTGHAGYVSALAVASDGALFSGSWDSSIKQWPGATWNDTNELWEGCQCIGTATTGHTGYVNVLAFDSDGTLVSGSQDKTIKHWR